jgi:pilus assembly protein Flp/PilA
MFAVMKRLWKDERGASAIEYGLIAGLIAAVIAVTVTSIGTQVETLFNNVLTGIGGK